MVDVGDETTYWLPYLQWVFIISRWMGSAMLFSNVKLNGKFCLDAVRLKKTTSIGRWPSSVHDCDDSHWRFDAFGG